MAYVCGRDWMHYWKESVLCKYERMKYKPRINGEKQTIRINSKHFLKKLNKILEIITWRNTG